MGPTLVCHTPTENFPHLLNRFSVEAATSPIGSGWTSPTKIVSKPPASPPAEDVSQDQKAVQADSAPTFPDIEWDPSLETYLKRVERLAKLGEVLPQTVPDGFPNTIPTARAWDGADFEDESDYVYTLTADDLDEVDGALQKFIGILL